MTSTAIDAQGTTLTVQNAIATHVAIGNLVSFTAFDGETAERDVSDLDSTAKEYRLSLQENGNVSIEVNSNLADAGHVRLRELRISRAVEEFKLTLSSGEIATFDGLVKNFPLAGGVDDSVKTSCTIRVTGSPVWT